MCNCWKRRLKFSLITPPGVLTHFLPGSARLRGLTFAETSLSAIPDSPGVPTLQLKRRIPK
jgi:hypothetical protein